jgi:hypothetical protein
VLNSPVVNLALAVLLTVMPGIWVLIFLGGIIITHLAFVSIEAALVIGVLLLILFLLYIHLAPKLSYLLIAVPMLFSFNIPYVAPLFAGMFLTPSSLIPVVFGTIIYYFSGYLNTLVRVETGDLTDMPLAIMDMYQLIVNTVFSDKEMLFTVLIFSLIVVATYILSRLAIDYAWYLAIVIIAVSNIIVFIMGNLLLGLNMSLFGIVLSTVASSIIIGLIQFFRCVIDYSRTEKVQYEDDDFYYYVKAVPKIKISAPERKVKRIK